MDEETELCQNCKVAPAAEPHPCPFAEEMSGNSEDVCNCCAQCAHECAMDI